MTAHDQYRENLPLYAVGALPSEESEPLERHLAECSACLEELSCLSEAAAQIAMAVQPAVPSPHLREQLQARLDNESSRPPGPVEGRRSIRRWRTRRVWFWAPAFASAIIAIAFAALWRHDREFVQENRELTSRLEANDRAVRQARELINMLTAGDAARITLVASGAKPQPEAKVVYSSRQRSLVLLAGSLSPLPARKTYELWLLPASGAQPIPAGTFKPDARGAATLVLSHFAGGVAAKGFAVTIEDGPGSAVPTMPIILSGSA
ncbi:MAG: anti-sigma factor [Candidatus Acidiferrales bacterium]